VSDVTPVMPTPGLLRLGYNALSARLFATIAASGFGDLRAAHGNVMEQLSFGDGLRLTDLAARAGMTAQSMGELVDDLVALGYVERRPDPADRRAKRIHLTERGAENVRVAFRAVEELERELQEVLGETAHRRLRRTLERLLAAYADPA
jgi:DNA-binding MarR family transcriptional regulator